MELKVSDYAGVCLVRPVADRIDHRVAADFEAVLMPHVDAIAASDGHLIINFEDVEFISSVGLRVLNVAL